MTEKLNETTLRQSTAILVGRTPSVGSKTNIVMALYVKVASYKLIDVQQKCYRIFIVQIS